MRAWAVGFFLLVVFFVALAVRLRVLMACALWSALCARLGAVRAARRCVRGWVLCARLDAVCTNRYCVRCVCSARAYF